MTLRLILIRHAKSSWDDPALADHDRDLNDRGRRSADAIGAWLDQHDYRPEVVLCSTARRTVETWKRLAPHVNGSTKVELSSALYHASPHVMMQALAPRLERSVMMISHNPGTAALAEMLVGTSHGHPKFLQFPTTATAVIDFDVPNWGAAKQGRLVDFAVPRDLLEASQKA